MSWRASTKKKIGLLSESIQADPGDNFYGGKMAYSSFYFGANPCPGTDENNISHLPSSIVKCVHAIEPLRA